MLIEIGEKESLYFRTKYMFITSFVYLCCRLYDRIWNKLSVVMIVYQLQ